ncbi:MAG: methyl-accepting chemotaxis protein [Lachnospiraceae bacterium]|nr:methyl-accepting chemotaxis protein [Lachnospiraceae bacterium]
MKQKVRKSLKKSLLSKIVIFVAVIIVIITQITIKLAVDNIQSLTNMVLARESVTYANEVHTWWSNIEERVSQTAKVIQSSPSLSEKEILNILLSVTASDPDSHDIYMAFGDTNVFLDGSGWTPDDTFVFTEKGWYQGALEKNGEIYTSQPYLDAATGSTSVACSIMTAKNTVLASDIDFDMIAEKVNDFTSISPEARYYIVNRETMDVIISNQPDSVGQVMGESTDGVAKGIAPSLESFDTGLNPVESKVKTIKTSAGQYMVTATDIQDTTWTVVCAVPSTLLSDAIIKVMMITFASAIIFLVILFVVMRIIINKAINPVTTITERITDISKGDFTVSIVPEGNNEITTLAESLNGYIDKMRTTLKSLSDISGSMNSRATECFDISHTLSDANQNQGESIEKLNSTLGDLNSSIEDIANAAADLASTSGVLVENAKEVRNLCDETLEVSGKGKDEMESMTRNVQTLNVTIGELSELIHATAKSIDEITGITDTINELSSQTNLLSLNASIEAARAGEMGKGFAVVASEVGSLATQSSEATENIRRLIEEVTHNIEEINKKSDICVHDMEACLNGVDGVNESFDLIYDDVVKAVDGIMDISNGIEKINDVASGNEVTTREQAANINDVFGLSDVIVSESNKLRTETENITTISENLNRYSDEINSDLSQYTV